MRTSMCRWTVAAFCATAMIVTGCSSEAEELPPRATADFPSPAATTTSGGVTPASGEPHYGRVAREYSGTGITPSLLEDLHAVQSATNYGLARDAPIPEDIFSGFVFVVLSRCSEVASGAITWINANTDDMLSGASSSDATRMNTFLRDKFCPQVDSSGY